MKNNILLKLLCSIPIILIFLYFIPFLGICLIVLRYLMYSRKNNTPILLIIFGAIILIPKVLNFILNVLKLNVEIPYLNNIINSELYSVDFIKYSKFLLIIGIILLILYFIFNKVSYKFSNFIWAYLTKQERQYREISEKNDLIIKEKQEKAKNTSVVYCPYCGADNIITSKTGTCKYCRRQIQAKD